MSPRARLAVLALVLVGAFIAVRVRQAAVGSGMAEAQPLPPAGEGTRAALTWLMVLTIPLLALLFVVALRFPRQRARPDAQRWTRATWRGLALMVALLLLIAAVLALAGRIPSTRLSPEDPTPDGPHGTTTRAPSTGRRPPADGDWAPLDIDGMVVFVVGALAALMIAAAIGNRRTRVAPDIPSPDAPTGEVRHPLLLAAQRALSAVDEPARNPREAIIRCYAALEQALRSSPGAVPQPADTPTDVLHRAAEAGLVRAEVGGRLVQLFTEARFSAHPMTVDDRESAADALRLILRDLGRPSWTPS